MFLSNQNMKFKDQIYNLKVNKQCKVNFKKGNVGPSF